MPNLITEEQIEKAILDKLTQELGYRHINAFTTPSDNINDSSGRTDKREVVLPSILFKQTQSLNPTIPLAEIEKALETLTKPRSYLSPVRANQEVYDLLRDGIPVEYHDEQGKLQHEWVKCIDFNNSQNNDFLAVSQLWIKGKRGFRRPDIILYINGLPLVFIELKNAKEKLETAFTDNLSKYKEEIPDLFMYNGFCMLSNAIETRVGSFTASWQYFFPWFRPEDEQEIIDLKQIQQDGTSIERAITGLLHKDKLLDFLENFILYKEESVKIIAENHQFIGVNKAILSLKNRTGNQGHLGVYWHTTGAGKSFSMIFFVRKVRQKFPADFTFVVITDRKDLDGQIYKNFLNTGTITKNECARPGNSEEMREFLGGNKRMVFTLIHKFRLDKGQEYPVLTTRDDIIVMVDEAHRTQYEDLALNMRKGLPNAQYIAFTATPLLKKDRTQEWFGGYVSEYTWVQSVSDGTTLPLFYKKRVPEVCLQNENLGNDFYQILDDDNLDETQQTKFENKYARLIEVITRDERLETIARDIVNHFCQRGYRGKAMVISVNKFTCVKMYNKVQKYWNLEKRQLQAKIYGASNDLQKEPFLKQMEFMKSTEMAVVVSEEAGENDKFKTQDLDIRPHRDKLNAVHQKGQDIESCFKAPDNPLRLVFVCSMWLCGFDVPTLSTIYIDKPMQGHSLMQALNRANRVSDYEINGVSKTNGEIIDYINVEHNLKRALKDYGMGSDNKNTAPIKEKTALYKLLEDALKEGFTYCKDRNMDLEKILQTNETFMKSKILKTYADILVSKDLWRHEFRVYHNTIHSLYEACKPEILHSPLSSRVQVFQYLRDILDSMSQGENLQTVENKISDLLDYSIVTAKSDSYIASPRVSYQPISDSQARDLSKIDFAQLRAEFPTKEYKNLEILEIRVLIEKKLAQMLNQNATRVDFALRFQEIIDAYNAGSISTELSYDELLEFSKNLNTEDERHIRLGLTEDELELFDVLKKEKMTKAEEQKVKLAAKELFHRLKEEKPKVLVQDWYKDTQSKFRVKGVVGEVLNHTLPDTYGAELFQARLESVFDMIYQYASDGVKWVA